MRKIVTVTMLLFLSASFRGKAQEIPVHPTLTGQGAFLGISRPLRDIPPMTPEEYRAMEQKAREKELNKGLRNPRVYPFAATALPKGEDPAWQKAMGKTGGSRSPLVNFEGQTSPYYPPDDNGTAGPDHYMQTINTVYAIYDKTGTLVAGPTPLNQIFGTVPGASRNDGDPIILFDEAADRWLVTEFSLGSTNYMLMAVSTTNDPTGTYYQYSFVVNALADYPKFSIWRDGYYMGDNNNSGNDIYVFERSQMLIGAPAQYVGFNNPYRPASSDGFMCVPPVDNDGPLAPVGSPGLYIAFNDDALGGGADELWIYELSVNWSNLNASTFNRVQQLGVLPFNANFGPTWNNITQPGTGQKLDGIPQVVMNVPQYRNFGGYQTIVCCHTVNLDGNGHAGIRWYELRRTTGDWEVRQQGTYGPDVHNRWMGSIMLNGHNKIALGYSISSTTEYPGIRYAGQSPAAYNSATGEMDMPEDTIQLGAYSQNGFNRWGDYALMAVDPTDDETFWFTSQYIGQGGSRKTKIASFKFITGPDATTLPATNVMAVSATLNGTVNPNGTATDYRFDYDTLSFNMGNQTPLTTAGSGTTPVNVSADITNLVPGKTYYFRVYATNASGVANGAKMSFTTGAPMLSVTPPSRNVPPAPGTAYFVVSANIGWTVTCDAAWCTVTPSGTGNDTIWIQYEENLVAATRIAGITVTGSNVPPQNVALIQDGPAAILSVMPPNRNVAFISDSTTFTVASNAAWSVTSNAGWCTATPSGLGNGTITAWFGENPSVDPRVATLTVSTLTGLTETVTVSQGGFPPVLAVAPPNRNVAATAGSTDFSVTSNTGWTVQSDASWCSVTSSGTGNGTLVANFTENTADQQRVANIGVTVTGLPQQVVTVTQSRSSIGVKEHPGSGVAVYPNPNEGVFRIVLPAGVETDIIVELQEVNGRTLKSAVFKGKKEYLMDYSELENGCYHLLVTGTSFRSMKKLVIIR